jgi:hypothetical protein
VARWRGGEEEDDRWGPGVSGGERENTADGRREVKKKTYSCEYANDSAGRAAVKPVGRGVERWLGPAGRPRPVGVAAGPAEAEAQGGEAGRLGRKLGRENKRISELKLDF